MTLPSSRLRDVIRARERAAPEEQLTLLSFLAGREVTIGETDLRAALRRAELLLAAGGDPRRPLELYGRAVSALAEDLDSPAARDQLAAGLEHLAEVTEGLRGAAEALRLLRSDRTLAWQCFALSLLAETLADAD